MIPTYTVDDDYHNHRYKPWSEITRQSKLRRIKILLPIPDTCPYCDRPAELHSKSGLWLEDLDDYQWLCRFHAGLKQQLTTVHDVPDLEAAVDNLDCLFPHWYNNTMTGTFEGSNILNKSALFGRFC